MSCEPSDLELREVLDHLIEGFQVLDFDWRYRYVNEAMLRHARRTRDELLGRTMLECFPSLQQTQLFQRLRRCMQERVSDAVEEGFTYPDGTRRSFELRIHPVPEGLCIVSLEVTDRERFERELAETVRQLGRSNEELESFTYTASHDLQEPLRTVASFARLLARQYRAKLDARADEYIQHVEDGVQRMQALVRDLLQYSRSGRPLELEPVDLQALLRDVMHDLEAAVAASHGQVDSDALPEVVGDRSRLRQVFLNLIANALKYRRGDAPRIRIRSERIQQGWRLSVVDNGIGFDPRHAEKIFEPFKRLHTPKEYPGTGLGLAMCKRIIERHGGSIGAESVPGEGSSFTFTVPDRRG